MKILKCYKIDPRKKLREYKTVDTLDSIEKAVGGIPEFVKVKLRSGKQISIVFDSAPLMVGCRKDYNFTLAVVPDDKKTWLDFMGPVLIFGRKDNELQDLELESSEIEELIVRPYDD